MSKTVFIASPLGFAASTDGFRLVLKETLNQIGYEVIDPWTLSDEYVEELDLAKAIENDESRKLMMHDISMKIAQRNSEHLRKSDAVLAVLDGVDVDSGTASEIGYAYGLGSKIINGIRTDFRRSGENDGVAVNLQVQYWIESSGGQIIHSTDDLSALIF